MCVEAGRMSSRDEPVEHAASCTGFSRGVRSNISLKTVVSAINDAEHHLVDLSQLRGLSVGEEPVETAPRQVQFFVP